MFLYSYFVCFSFLPKSEKCTYRLGLDFKSSNNDAALAVVVLKLLYKVGSLNNNPMELSLLFSLLVSNCTLFKVESIRLMVAA